MMAASIAKALAGVPSGSGWVCRCPCPGHGKRRGDLKPSLSIHDGDTTLLVKCFAGCDPRDVLDELRHRGLLDDESKRRRLDLDKVGEGEPSPTRRQEVVGPDPEALRLWRSAAPIAGTLAERYLERRGITSPPPSLRSLPSVEYLCGRVHLPAMVAAVQGPDRSVIAAQVTYLKPDGSVKATVATPRRTTGMLGTGAVRLGAAGDTLGIAEGVETGLAAQQLTGVPTWASLGAGRMHRVQVPNVVTELHIFADDDETGRAAAERVANAHLHRRVLLRYPPNGCKDWADVLQTESALA